MSGNERFEPFGGTQIAAVADLVWKRRENGASPEDNPIHPLGENIEDALRATNDVSQDIHREPAD